MRSYLENMKWAEILENKTAEQCWESLKSEFDYMIQKFIPNKKSRHLRKKHLSREAMQMLRKKQRLWKAYKRTGKVEDYTKYKDALKETTNEIRESKRNFERKLAANIKRTPSPYFRNLPLLHITIRLHLTWRLLKFMRWLARKQYILRR